MSFWDIWIYKSEAPRFVSFKEIDLHAHQKHVVLFLDQDRNVMDFKLLILRLRFIKSQCIGHPATASAFDSYS